MQPPSQSVSFASMLINHLDIIDLGHFYWEKNHIEAFFNIDAEYCKTYQMKGV